MSHSTPADLAAANDLPINLPSFFGMLLRGMGQVMFQNSAHAGFLFTLGIAANDWRMALAALVGTCSSTLSAMALGAERNLLRSGMYGFKGALVAIAMLTFLEGNAVTWACLIVAAACSSLVMAAMLAAFEAWKLPVLTAPFVLVCLCVFLASARFGHLQPTGLLSAAAPPHTADMEGMVAATTLFRGSFMGLAQVFFQGSVATGVLFFSGLLVASPRASVVALLASLVGALVAWSMGTPEVAIHGGVYGFNSVLVAIALATVFLPKTTASLAYALAGAAITPFAAAALAAALEPLGLPAMTLPFVLVTWLLLLAARRLSAIASSGLAPTA